MCAALDAALAPAAVLADARGRALVWDACRVLHAAVYLPERAAAPRCSVEVRCSVLSRADVLRHRDALVAAVAEATMPYRAHCKQNRAPRASDALPGARDHDVAGLLRVAEGAHLLQEDVLVPGRAGVAAAVEGELARVGPDVVPEVVVEVVVVDAVRLDDLVPLVRRQERSGKRKNDRGGTTGEGCWNAHKKKGPASAEHAMHPCAPRLQQQAGGPSRAARS